MLVNSGLPRKNLRVLKELSRCREVELRVQLCSGTASCVYTALAGCLDTLLAGNYFTSS